MHQTAAIAGPQRLYLVTMLWVVAESSPVEISSANSTRVTPTSISPAVTRFFCLQGSNHSCRAAGLVASPHLPGATQTTPAK